MIIYAGTNITSTNTENSTEDVPVVNIDSVYSDLLTKRTLIKTNIEDLNNNTLLIAKPYSDYSYNIIVKKKLTSTDISRVITTVMFSINSYIKSIDSIYKLKTEFDLVNEGMINDVYSYNSDELNSLDEVYKIY